MTHLKKLQQTNTKPTMALLAHRQIIIGGAPINKNRRRRPQIVGGGGSNYNAYTKQIKMNNDSRWSDDRNSSLEFCGLKV